MAFRRETEPVHVGDLVIGGGNPIVIQTMWEKPVESFDEVLKEKLNSLVRAGAQLIRFAIPNEKAIPVVGAIAKTLPIPLSADIHYNYKHALLCMDYPIKKIRINPGNIGAAWKVSEIITKAADKGVAIRVGVNEGSLGEKFKHFPEAESAIVEAAEEQLNIFERVGFNNIVVSLKSSSTETTYKANKIFSEVHKYPLHIGVTEAGPMLTSLVRNSVSLGNLLKEGIGDTVRISISDDPFYEVVAAKELLRVLNLPHPPGIELISCPQCGRSSFDVSAFYRDIEKELFQIPFNLKVAIMGCPVNGPGEASHADIGISGQGKSLVLFKKGKRYKTIPIEGAGEALRKEITSLTEE